MPTRLDVLFFQAGFLLQEVDGPQKGTWKIQGGLPDELPASREYWLVFRFNRQGIPDLAAVPLIAAKVREIQNEAKERNLSLSGIQLDVDSPTKSLSEYAVFLREVHKVLPPEMGVSITALLDWFREGTSIGDVIDEVDEFAPQFYDTAPMLGLGASPTIAAKLDAAKWGPVLNRFHKRFRIGIATFGRARRLRVTPAAPSGEVQNVYVDQIPADFAGNPAFSLQTSRSEAGEGVLTYKVLHRPLPPSLSSLIPGDVIQFILPTTESVRSAVESARKIGGYSAGVLFFRWPSRNETLTMDPDIALASAGFAPASTRLSGGVQVADAGCAAVKCMDLYLTNAEPLRSTPVRLVIHSSKRLEYFLPELGVPIRMVGPSDLELRLPSYGGRRSLYVGRAVVQSSALFTVQEKP